MLDSSIEAARIKGRVASVLTGTESTTHDLAPAFYKSVTIHPENMSIPLMTGQGREFHGQLLTEAATLADQGKLKPLIDSNRFTFEQANEAHAYFESKKHIGKIVLTRTS